MSDRKFVIGVVVASVALLFGGAFLVSRVGNNSSIGVGENVKIVTGLKAHDWGDIDINGGLVEASFEIRNDGSDVLKLYNVKTSCSCTIVQFVNKDSVSPTFGMHTKSSYVEEVGPGDSVQVKAIFDPAFHGPDAVGPITRQVTIDTNDPNNKQVSFMMTGTVVR